jgi:norsolorinic acid ketoreductase
VRDPKAALSQELLSLQAGKGSKVILIKIDSAVDSDPQAAITDLQQSYGIKKIDVVIANAGIAEHAAVVAEASPEAIRQHLDVNLIGVITLFQATAVLLQKSSQPKFFVLSSMLGSLNLIEAIPGPWLAYGITKAALNYTVRKIHFENEWLTAVALSPGFTQTDMGAFAARIFGVEAAPLPLEVCIEGLIAVVRLQSSPDHVANSTNCSAD